MSPWREDCATFLASEQGRAVRVDPNKPTLKASVIKHSKLKHDKPLSNFAFKFNVRRFSKGTRRSRRRRPRWDAWASTPSPTL